MIRQRSRLSIAHPFDRVYQFHKAFDVEVADKPVDAISDELYYLRTRLHKEEMTELHDAMQQNDIVEIADALADLIYVLYGSAVSFGIPLKEIFEEVHRSNMSKLGLDGRPIFRHDGKVLKGPNFTPPNIAAILEEYK